MRNAARCIVARGPALMLLLALATSATAARAGDAGATDARAQGEPYVPTPAPRAGPLFHPDGPGLFRWRASVGVQVDILPRRVVESEMREVPELTANFRFGLPLGFSTDVRASGNVIGNQIALGVAWSHRIGDFSFSVLDHQALWLGFVGLEGFDATGSGLLNFPGVSVGVPMKNVRFTLLGEAIVTFAQHTTLGDSSTTSRSNVKLAGTSATLTVETLLDSGGIVYFGAGLLRATPGYEAWIAFSDENAKLPYPRFVGGYVF